ncbi:MAG: hypothetical protein Q7T57_03910, partial [Dehalococcoidales bacterium]|nr:hypothetical protein [Dehalococcoidales bacterium]
MVTEQRMRPVPKNQNGASWLRIADATVWEIIADFRLTAKLLENAAACWFGPSLSCLSGRTAAYRSCILKPTVYAGPCNPYANRFFEADKFGFRPEDYAKPTEIADRLQRQLHRTDVFHDALSAVTIQQLVTSHNMRQLVIPVKKETRSATSFTEKKDPSGSGIRTSESNRSNSPHHTSRSEPERQPSPLSPQPRNQPTALNLTAIVAAMESHAETVPSSPVSSIVLARDADRVSVPPTRPNSPVAQLEQEHTYGASNSTAPSLTTSIESTVPPIVSGESATVSSTAIASTVPSSSDEFPPDEHAVSTLPLGDVKKHSTFDIDRVTDSSELLLKLSADGDTKEPSGINSQNLPLMFYSFCIHFCNDYFVQPWAASHLHSGDDKFLTRYLICRGWLLYMQVGEDVAIETTFKPNWNFLKQYMRWTRNTWRSDFRAILKERMVWYSTRYWFLIYLMFDKCIAPFTLIFGPILVIWICAHSSVGLYATMGEPDRNYRLPLWNIVVSYV